MADTGLDWYCPACGTRLSYGVYCKACAIEPGWEWRPVTERDLLIAAIRVILLPRLDSPALDSDFATAPGTISPQQQRAIHAACTGMDRDKRLATISDIVGRPVVSSNELSYTEAARVLEKLQ